MRTRARHGAPPALVLQKWPKFGVAADAGAGTTTYVSHDPIYMADPNQREEEEDMSQKLMRIREQAATRRRVIDKVEGELGLAGAPEAAAAASSGPDGVEPRPTSLADKFANRGPGGAYVPPGRRGIAEGRVEEQTTTLRITPLSSTVTEMALRELCGEFGRCNVRLPRRYNGEAHDFAFVTFSHREDAERARNKLNGHRYEYTVLEVDWAKPSTRNRDGLAGQRVSGYGKALPQTARR